MRVVVAPGNTLYTIPSPSSKLHSPLNATVQCKLLVLHAQCRHVNVYVDEQSTWHGSHGIWVIDDGRRSSSEKRDTWEKPIEIVSSLLQLPMAMGMDCVCAWRVWAVPSGFCYRLHLAIIGVVRVCVSQCVCVWGHTFATSAFDLYENSKQNSGQFVKFPCAHAAHWDFASSISY